MTSCGTKQSPTACCATHCPWPCHSKVRSAALQDDLAIQKQWYINGKHYSRTLEAWLQRMDAQRKQIMPIFEVSAQCWDLGLRED